MTRLFVDVDRSSPVPLYFQVAQQIEHAINEGDLAPGDRLDNEISLAEQIGLSRPTMRRAIQELVDKGLLVRKRGVGTQVVHGQVTRPVELTSLFDDLTTHHQTPTTVVLTNEVMPASDEVGVMLAIPTGSPILHLRRLRYAHGEPLAIMENFLPEDLISHRRDGPGGPRDVPAHAHEGGQHPGRQAAYRRQNRHAGRVFVAGREAWQPRAHHGASGARRLRTAGRMGPSLLSGEPVLVRGDACRPLISCPRTRGLRTSVTSSPPATPTPSTPWPLERILIRRSDSKTPFSWRIPWQRR